MNVDKEPSRIAGMFDAIARRYDTLNHLLSAGLDRRWRRKAIASVQIRNGGRVLDLCTGTADVAITMARMRDGGIRIVGVDFSREMLAIARDKVRRAGLERRVALVRGDASSIPATSRCIDAITIAFGIRNVQKLGAALAEMVRVLRPGGRLAILEFGIPRAPVIRQVYLWYFRRILPRVGALISGDPAAYAYLPASVDAFAHPDVLMRDLVGAGFEHVRVDSLSFGIVYLYSAATPVAGVRGQTPND